MGIIDEATSSIPDLLNDGRMTHFNSPTEATARWSGTTAVEYNGTNQYSDADFMPFPDGVEKGSFAFTFDPASTGYFLNQNNGSGVFIACFNDSLTRMWCQVSTSSGNAVDSITGSNFLSAGVPTTMLCTWDLTTQEIEIDADGSEVTYFRQNNVTGSPAATVSTGTNLRVGAWSGPALHYAGGIEFPIFWNDRVLTTGERAQFWTEIQAYPPPAATPAGPNGPGRLGIGAPSWAQGGRAKRRRRRR